MIKVEKLSISYKSTGKNIIAGVSFDIKEGEVVAILGPSGCGKTTILNTIAGLLTDKEIEKSGAIEFFKNDPKISFVFQSPNLLPWRDVSSNISYGLEMSGSDEREIEERRKEILEIIGLSGVETYYPKQLSLGMQQRVNFARALVTHPDILILDEPFVSLDQETKDKIRQNFLEIIKEKRITSIFVTHDREEARLLADKIIVLSSDNKTKESIFLKEEFSKIK